MTTTELLKPILTGGIRSVNFFNGRLLSGEDMSREQEANREAHKMMGRAIGDGIAYGFEVSRAAGAGADAIVTVQPGLAINRNGTALRLSGPIDLSLVRPQNGSSAVTGVSFNSCTPFQSGVYVTGSGVYLLTVSPARAAEGRAAVSGLNNAAADCNTKYLVDGVQFRLIQLDLTATELNDQNHLRNLVAYKCFGVDDLKSILSNPFGTDLNQYGLIDSLRTKRLTDCDVPLAVLHWTASGGIRFIDLWSVRRMIIVPATGRESALLTANRRHREAEAMLLQFQDELEALRLNESNLRAVIVKDRFRFLPPTGLIPLGTVRAAGGFDYQSLFSGIKYRQPVFIEGATVEQLIRDSLSYTPIDLESGEMIWLYRVRENMQTIAAGAPNPPQPYLIFASGHLPYRGHAHFDLSHWNYSNYS